MTPSVKVNALSDWDDTLSLTLDIETNRVRSLGNTLLFSNGLQWNNSRELFKIIQPLYGRSQCLQWRSHRHAYFGCSKRFVVNTNKLWPIVPTVYQWHLYNRVKITAQWIQDFKLVTVSHVDGEETFTAVCQKTKMFLPHPRVRLSIVGSLRDREVACSASDRQGLNFESCVRRAVSSHSSHHH